MGEVLGKRGGSLHRGSHGVQMVRTSDVPNLGDVHRTRHCRWTSSCLCDRARRELKLELELELRLVPHAPEHLVGACILSRDCISPKDLVGAWRLSLAGRAGRRSVWRRGCWPPSPRASLSIRSVWRRGLRGCWLCALAPAAWGCCCRCRCRCRCCCRRCCCLPVHTRRRDSGLGRRGSGLRRRGSRRQARGGGSRGSSSSSGPMRRAERIGLASLLLFAPCRRHDLGRRLCRRRRHADDGGLGRSALLGRSNVGVSEESIRCLATAETPTPIPAPSGRCGSGCWCGCGCGCGKEIYRLIIKRRHPLVLHCISNLVKGEAEALHRCCHCHAASLAALASETGRARGRPTKHTQKAHRDICGERRGSTQDRAPPLQCGWLCLGLRLVLRLVMTAGIAAAGIAAAAPGPTAALGYD